MDSREAIEAMRTLIGAASAMQFSDTRTGPGDTQWGVCPECGGADWEGHDEGCAVASTLGRARAALAWLEEKLLPANAGVRCGGTPSD